MDVIYEGKAHEWMRENINTDKEKTLFWIVGKQFGKEEVNNLIKM